MTIPAMRRALIAAGIGWVIAFAVVAAFVGVLG